MKIRTALPLIYVLSFLIVSAVSGRAQTGLTPDYLVVSLDSSFLTYDLSQPEMPSYKVGGYVENILATADFAVKIYSAKQWVISVKIGGVVVNDGDFVSLAENQKIPVELTVVPYADRPDTETYCISLSAGGFNQGGGCLTLAIPNVKSAVSTDIPSPNVTVSPNPAGSYISLRGLEDVQAVRYEIYSVSGAEVHHGMLPADARINVQDLSSGAYRLLLSDGKRTFFNTAITVLH